MRRLVSFVRASFVRVVGTSMVPTLDDGDFVVVVPLSPRVPFARATIGAVVVARHPELGLLVKRVVERATNGWVALGGDGPWSTAPEHLGFVPQEQIVGRALFRIARGEGRTRGLLGVHRLRTSPPPRRHGK